MSLFSLDSRVPPLPVFRDMLQVRASRSNGHETSCQRRFAEYNERKTDPSCAEDLPPWGRCGVGGEWIKAADVYRALRYDSHSSWTASHCALLSSAQELIANAIRHRGQTGLEMAAIHHRCAPVSGGRQHAGLPGHSPARLSARRRLAI